MGPLVDAAPATLVLTLLTVLTVVPSNVETAVDAVTVGAPFGAPFPLTLLETLLRVVMLVPSIVDKTVVAVAPGLALFPPTMRLTVPPPLFGELGDAAPKTPPALPPTVPPAAPPAVPAVPTGPTIAVLVTVRLAIVVEGGASAVSVNVVVVVDVFPTANSVFVADKVTVDSVTSML